MDFSQIFNQAAKTGMFDYLKEVNYGQPGAQPMQGGTDPTIAPVPVGPMGQVGTNPYDQQVKDARAKQFQAPPQEKGMGFGTPDLIVGLVPTLIAALMGKSGQEFAGGYAKGYLGGKQNDTSRQNQNAMQGWQASQQQNQANVQNLEQDQRRWDQNQQWTAEMGYKRDVLENKAGAANDKAAEKIKTMLFDPKADPSKAEGMLYELSSKYGVTYPPEIVHALTSGTYYSKGAEAKAGLDASKKVGQDIKNTFDQAANPVKLEGLNLKNKQLGANIQNTQWRSMQIKKLLPAKVKELAMKYKMDEAHAAVYAATALTIGPKAEADIAKSWATVNNLNSLTDERKFNMPIKSQQIVNSSLNTGLSTLSTQINTKEASIKALTKELLEADDKTKPLLQHSLTVQEGELKVLRQSYDMLKGQAAHLRQQIGLNDDGTRGRQKAWWEPKDLAEKQAAVSQLSNEFQQQFGGTSQIGSGEPRNIKGTNTPSLHNEKAAADLFPQSREQLPATALWATQQPGVQTVIYNRRVWTPAKGWHAYTTKGDPHLDHVHVDYGRNTPAPKPQGNGSFGPRGNPNQYDKPIGPGLNPSGQTKTRSGVSFSFGG